MIVKLKVSLMLSAVLSPWVQARGASHSLIDGPGEWISGASAVELHGVVEKGDLVLGGFTSGRARAGERDPRIPEKRCCGDRVRYFSNTEVSRRMKR